MDRFKAWLNAPEDGRKLGLFRLVFGICIVVRMVDYYRIEFIQKGILAPLLHFTFEGFGWVKPLPNAAMQVILAAMLVSAVLLALGRWMREACAVLAVGSWYFLFLEKAYFNNHLYLFILIYVLLIFTEADRFFSWNQKPAVPREVPRWQVFILQLQIMVVYFYGGLAKLNGDWLFRQEPVRSMLAGGMFGGNELAIQFFNIGGLAIDLFAPILLWWKPARRWAIWAYLFFHVTNAVNFDDIGVFPFVMTGALVLFLDNQEIGWLYRFFEKRKRNAGAKSIKAKKAVVAEKPVPPFFGKPARWATVFLTTYFLFQFLFPLRGYFLANPQDYTTIGNRFSWRMKIDNRANIKPAMKIKYFDRGNTEAAVPLGDILNTVQIAYLATDPRALVDLAKFSKETASKNGWGRTEVYSNIRFSYNGRPEQNFVNPLIGLSDMEIDPMQKVPWLVLPEN